MNYGIPIVEDSDQRKPKADCSECFGYGADPIDSTPVVILTERKFSFLVSKIRARTTASGDINPEDLLEIIDEFDDPFTPEYKTLEDMAFVGLRRLERIRVDVDESR